MKIDKSMIAEVTTGFSELKGMRKCSFGSMTEFDNAAAARFEEGGGYYKTDFTIKFVDGGVYTGRYDIGCDTDTLEEHVIASLKYSARASEKAESMSWASWARYLDGTSAMNVRAIEASLFLSKIAA